MKASLKARAQMKKYYLFHKKKSYRRSLEWRAKNPEKYLATIRRYHKNRPEIEIFWHARRRCTNPNDIGYKNYGGRGIRFLLKNPLQIIRTIGPRPSKRYSIDRINNNGHYEVGNIRWATRQQQQNNRRYSYAPKI